MPESDKKGSDRFTISDLLYLMARLRDPQTGCPWDIKQTFGTIAPSTIEEAYEVVDAIENGDLDHVREELGDLLFQVIFYSQMGSEQKAFDFNDIVHTLVDKLIRRHPHVFANGELHGVVTGDEKNEDQVKQQWEDIKQAERAGKGQSGLLDDVPKGLPAITRAAKLQKRAAQVGFDWSDWRGVLEKLKEEVHELELAAASNNKNAMAEELGDVLFSCVNLARHLKQEPESALRKANQKFTDRFNYIEKRLQDSGIPMEKEQVQMMERYWEEAKSLQRKSAPGND